MQEDHFPLGCPVEVAWRGWDLTWALQDVFHVIGGDGADFTETQILIYTFPLLSCGICAYPPQRGRYLRNSSIFETLQTLKKGNLVLHSSTQRSKIGLKLIVFWDDSSFLGSNLVTSLPFILLMCHVQFMKVLIFSSLLVFHAEPTQTFDSWLGGEWVITVTWTSIFISTFCFFSSLGHTCWSLQEKWRL